MNERYLRQAGRSVLSQLDFQIKDAADYLAVNYFGWRSGRFDPALLEEQQSLAVRDAEIEIVFGDQNGLLFFYLQVLEKMIDLELKIYIQMGTWRIQEENRRLLGQSPGDEHSLPFPAASLAEVFLFESGHPGQSHSLFNF